MARTVAQIGREMVQIRVLAAEVEQTRTEALQKLAAAMDPRATDWNDPNAQRNITIRGLMGWLISDANLSGFQVSEIAELYHDAVDRRQLSPDADQALSAFVEAKNALTEARR